MDAGPRGFYGEREEKTMHVIIGICIGITLNMVWERAKRNYHRDLRAAQLDTAELDRRKQNKMYMREFLRRDGGKLEV